MSFRWDPYGEDKREEEVLPLKWHDFLLRAGLYLNAFEAVMSGIRFLSGTAYGLPAWRMDDLYRRHPGLGTLDVAAAIAQFAWAVLIMKVRSLLADRRKAGPRLLLAAYLSGVVLALGFRMAFRAITGVSGADAPDPWFWLGLALNLALTAANGLYYRRRAHLFE